ncbi:Cob(I)yrinic acid a,c-diamide adenosyltransferase [Limihaloglobus sulfuriphilus]|uniref:corrinoid adenosyltransferase n=1 Tax=Limihaloglobus sulfuriphilus TaxID=1851148 RepID=A0A1Q2MFS8_9BACT|nr:cob(I)yrinic acid a,c-diamide adenosyltransferase [Limihaloglobus sulfuriphilus]AQQ71555.1 Cob(I)yrinic acid a,c-diamide adenosyltransferase [Limihaloglobus sulfuriphilus]
MIKQSLVQIYTGQGKGKTTAALGLAFRACGNGNRVLIYQFLKPAGLDLSERRAAADCGLDIEMRAMKTSWDMLTSLDDLEVYKKTAAEIKTIITELRTAAASGEYDMIILDEIVFCESKGLAEFDDIKKLITTRARGTEIVMTGRGASDKMIELADLVSEMRQIKHPFQKGIAARKGIEY